MQNKPTDMHALADTATAAEIEALQKEAIATLINTTGAMIKQKNRARGSAADPSPFEIAGFISMNLPEPIMTCFAQKTPPAEKTTDCKAA